MTDGVFAPDLSSEAYKRDHERYLHKENSARACSGLDMSNVPAGAVKKLVEAAFGILTNEEYPFYKLQDALAPFKE